GQRSRRLRPAAGLGAATARLRAVRGRWSTPGTWPWHQHSRWPRPEVCSPSGTNAGGSMTGRICIDLLATLDGVAQGPGGPEEDTSGGFRFGGWQAPLPDAMVGREVQAGMEHMDALLLGRRTYDIFSAYWPHHVTGEEGGIGRLFNRIPKYV